MKMTPTFYERNRTGDLMARATNDLGAVSVTAGFGILTLIDSTLFMATILTVMVGLISWKLTLGGDAAAPDHGAAHEAFRQENPRAIHEIAGCLREI